MMLPAQKNAALPASKPTTVLQSKRNGKPSLHTSLGWKGDTLKICRLINLMILRIPHTDFEHHN